MMIPLRGTWTFFNNVDVGAEGGNKQPISVWIESESLGGSRSTASNTLTIHPKQ